jgi:hypothetical protein
MRGRGWAIAGLATGGAFFLVGLVLALLQWGNEQECNTSTGVLAQGLSTHVSNECSRDQLIFVVGVGALVVGAIAAIACAILLTMNRGRRVLPPQWPEPGWYVPPGGVGPAWWDGSRYHNRPFG